MAKDTVQFMFIDGVELVIEYDWKVLADFWMDKKGTSATVNVGSHIIHVDKLLWVRKI